jgi:hypothetical protein
MHAAAPLASRSDMGRHRHSLQDDVPLLHNGSPASRICFDELRELLAAVSDRLILERANAFRHVRKSDDSLDLIRQLRRDRGWRSARNKKAAPA